MAIKTDAGDYDIVDSPWFVQGPPFLDGWLPRGWQQGVVARDSFPEFHGDPAARAVLEELQSDPSPKVRAMAEHGLNQIRARAFVEEMQGPNRDKAQEFILTRHRAAQ
jgi:hypothetical protein